MIRRILSISGRPGLYKLVSQGKNMLIVESLATGKRTPAYAHDKVISLNDVSIYTQGEDIPLADVFDKIAKANDAQQVDIKKFGSDNEMRAYFGEVLPEFDPERVYNNDIKKVFSWYNQLISAGVTKFKEDEIKEDVTAEAAEKADETK